MFVTKLQQSVVFLIMISANARKKYVCDKTTTIGSFFNND